MEDGFPNAGWDSKPFHPAEALRFLQANMLESTGQRIWGLVFTLYPDGRFNIEYDYKKPENYEDTDETISGAEINASLNALSQMNNGKK